MLELYGNLYTGDGTSQATINKPFWAKVTAYDGSKYYAWSEYVSENAVLVALPGGRFGTVTINPAWEPNGYLITVNSYVLLRRADFSPTYDWTYVAIAVSAPSGSPPGSTINYLTSTLNYDSSTLNYQTSNSDYTSSSIYYNHTSQYLNTTPGNPSNYNNTTNSFLQLQPHTVFVYGPPSPSTPSGNIQFTAPIEICGYVFWCCTTYTIPTSVVNNFPLPSAASVFDLTPASPDSTITGIQPQIVGIPTNTGAITNATNASPIVLTVPGWINQPAVGDSVKVTGVLGNTAANGVWTVQASSGTTLTLQGSTGNGAFAASANSTVEMAGPQLIVLRNATTGTDNLIIDGVGSAGAANSDPANRITLPPAYGTSVTLARYDSIILWWDSCAEYQWRVLACTVQHTANAGVKGEVGGAGLTANFRTILNFLNGGGLTWTVADNAGLSSLDISAVASGVTSINNIYTGNVLNLTTSYTESDLNMELPSVGTYIILVYFLGTITATNAGALGTQVLARLRDITNGIDIVNTDTIVTTAQVVNIANPVTCVIPALITTSVINTKITISATITSVTNVSGSISGTTASSTQAGIYIRIA